MLPGDALDLFLSMGWYRMHQDIFTTTHVPNDKVLYRAHWLRYPVSSIRVQTSHRRIRNRNRNFRVIVENCTGIRQDHEELFIRYRASIDFDGALNVQHCLFGDEGINRNVYKTKCISVFDGDRLIAGGYFDLGNESAASILHFFDTMYKSKSLGKYLLLITADFLKEAGYTFYYPGYLVAGLPKMDYKLFIGKEATQYFDPAFQTWTSFHENILLLEEPGDEDRMELNKVFGIGEGVG
jgi:arginine-tRNA-protein transferase